MATTNAAYIDGVQILYNSAYTARAITLDTAAFADGICKAGTPIAVDGKIANSNAAIGILLHDVYVERPQGTLVYYGTIRRDVAEAHCGLTYVDAMMAALKNVVFFKKEAAE
jgi:hypothetical protein